MGEVLRAGERVTRRVEPDGEIADQRKQIVATSRWCARIEDWRRRQPDRIPTFSEAVRILVERGLDADEPRTHPTANNKPTDG